MLCYTFCMYGIIKLTGSYNTYTTYLSTAIPVKNVLLENIKLIRGSHHAEEELLAKTDITSTHTYSQAHHYHNHWCYGCAKVVGGGALLNIGWRWCCSGRMIGHCIDCCCGWDLSSLQWQCMSCDVMYRHLFKQLCSRCLLGAASTASWEDGICGGDGLGFMRGLARSYNNNNYYYYW